MINIQNTDDNKSFVRFVNRGDHNPRRITKTDKDFSKRIGFKRIKFPFKIRGIHKIEKKEFHPHKHIWLGK